MPEISMIAAMAKNRVIGAGNAMPWHLPADLKHFKKITLGKPVVMGRKTYESIGCALPKRQNIVISRSDEFQCNDAIVVNSVEQALHVAEKSLTETGVSRGESGDLTDNHNEIMIIGGGAIYALCLPLAERLYLTRIDLDVAGDTVFPDYEQAANWTTVSSERHEPDDKNPFRYEFITLQRR